MKGSVFCYGSDCPALAQHQDSIDEQWYCKGCFDALQPCRLRLAQTSFALSLQNLDCASSTASTETDTDGSSTMAYSAFPSPTQTPVLRHRALPTPSRGHRRPHRSTSHGRRSVRSREDSRNVDRVEKKRCTERDNRGEFQAVHHLMEEILENYGHLIEGPAQTSGNKGTSGLKYRKIDLQMQFIVLSLKNMQARYEDALRTRTLQQLNAENRAIIEKFVDSSGGMENATENTFLADSGPRCAHASKSKRCTTHGHPDWAECRTLQKKRVFDGNVKSFMANL